MPRIQLPLIPKSCTQLYLEGTFGKRALQIPDVLLFCLVLFCFVVTSALKLQQPCTDLSDACDDTMLFEKYSVSLTLPPHRVVACCFLNENIWAIVFPESISFPGSLSNTAASDTSQRMLPSLPLLPAMSV